MNLRTIIMIFNFFFFCCTSRTIIWPFKGQLLLHIFILLTVRLQHLMKINRKWLFHIFFFFSQLLPEKQETLLWVWSSLLIFKFYHRVVCKLFLTWEIYNSFWGSTKYPQSERYYELTPDRWWLTTRVFEDFHDFLRIFMPVNEIWKLTLASYLHLLAFYYIVSSLWIFGFFLSSFLYWLAMPVQK